MPDTRQSLPLPDAASRLRALSDYTTTLLVEAGAGSGKTALLAGRVALMLTHGIRSREVVAITFTEAAAAELLERIERFVAALAAGTVPRELQLALPSGLSAGQAAAITRAKAVLDEITCTTIHGFCQQLIHPYPIEAGIDPGATIIDPAAADLAYQELMQAWLSARFGREGDDAGLGRIPRIEAPGGEDDFFAELIAVASDGAVKLISATAAFLRKKRTARAVAATLDLGVLAQLSQAIRGFAAWYAGCGIVEPATAETVADLGQFRQILDEAARTPITGRTLARLLLHDPPRCRNKKEPRFNQWGETGKWERAARDAGFSRARGTQLA